MRQPAVRDAPLVRTARLLLCAFLLLACLPKSGHSQFGRNKLQHRTFDFQVIQTAHFDVYYYPREREAALDAARLAERSYNRLSRILGIEFEDRKPVILYASHSEFQQTNALPGFIAEGTGGVTEFAKRRVIMPFTGSYADFEHVLTHELVHAFQYEVIARGLASQLGSLNFDIPLWFMEGMAEYLAIGELDTHTDAWLRDAVMSGYLRTIPEMSLYSDYLSYRFGQSVWAFIGAKYGDETIGLLLQRGMRLGLPGAFQVTLGVSIEQLSDEWIESLRTIYLPEVARFADAEEVGKRITRHAFRPRSGEFASYLAPALSPDGNEIVYLSDRGNKLYSFFDLWLASAEDGEIKGRLVEAARSPDFESLRFMNSSAAWSGDSRHLAFVAKVGGRDALYVYDIRRRRVVRRVTADVDGMQNPSFSPDGMRIAFTGLKGGVSDLYVVDVSGEHFQQLTDDKYADLHPAWSPDGRFIAIATDRGEATDFENLVFGNFRIALYDVSSGLVELLPQQGEGKNISPVWSPTGESIAFVSDRTGVNNVFIWSLAEARLYQVTDLLSGVSGILPMSPAISWAAGADRLAFTYFEGAGYNIYTLDNPRGQARPVENSSPALPVVAPGSLPEAAGGNFELASAIALKAGASSQSLYKVPGGFRASARMPAGEEVEPPRELTVAELLRDASSGLPDTTAFELREYDPKLTPDIIGQPVIGAQVGGYFGNGIYGGSYILLSDILGDHNLLLWGQIAGSFNDAYLLTRYSYLRERVNVSMAYQQYPLYRFRGTIQLRDPSNQLFFEDRFIRDVYRILSTDVHYPLSMFQRLEFSVLGAYVSRDSVVERIATGIEGDFDRFTTRLENLVFAGPGLALVWDNSLFGFTGPIAGRRYRVAVGKFFGDVEITDVTLDLRNYWSLSGRFTLATRFTGYSRSGPGEDEFRLYWGGPYFIRGYDGSSFNAAECSESARRITEVAVTICPVRDQLIGSSVALASAEFRFPILTFLDFGVVPLGLPPVDGVLFYDAGVAFNSFAQLNWSRARGSDPYDVRVPVAAYGFGLRMNILYNVLRLDYAIPLDRPDHGNGIWSLSFGPTF